MKNFYDILGVQKNASSADIKSAYRKKAMQYHPDKNNGNASAEEKFKEIQEAYEILSDEKKKEYYDKTGAAPGRNSNQRSNTYNDPFREYYQNSNPFEGFESPFESFFRNGFSNFNSGGTNFNKKPIGEKGKSVKIKIPLTLKEIYNRVQQKQVSMKVPKVCNTCKGSGSTHRTLYVNCDTCSGQGFMQQRRNSPFGQTINIIECESCSGTGKKMKNPCQTCNGNGISNEYEEVLKNIPIPIGITGTLTYKIQNEGYPGLKGGAAGDIHVQIEELPHDFIERNHDDLIDNVYVSIETAIFGGDIEVDTWAGKKILYLDAGLPNKLFMFKGLGFPIIETSHGYSSQQRGDYIIKIHVDIPTSLSQEQKNLIKALNLDNPTRVL